MTFVFLYLTSPSMIISRSIHVVANNEIALFHSFYGRVYIFVIYTVYPLICLCTFRLFPYLGNCK